MAKRNDIPPQGPNQRQLRVGELIRRAVSETLARGDIHDEHLAHVSVTVGEVRPTPDLKNALIFVLPLGGQNSELVIEALNRNAYEIRRALNKKVALKFSPKLKFVLDTTFDNLDETRRLLSLDQVAKDIAVDED